MREFVSLPVRVWSFVAVLTGWLIPMGIVRLIKADTPLAVGMLLLLVGIALAVILFIHRAQWRSSERLADKRRAEEEQRSQAEAYQREIEARKREYEAYRRRNRLDGTDGPA